jgi:cardiolipin synthase
VSGVCVSAAWLGDPTRGREPWRDTGVALRGPAVADLVHAFAETWAALGEPLPNPSPGKPVEPAGDVALRVIATLPSSAGTFRIDQLIAALSRTGYRALLEAGIRIFEWKGPMLHAKTAVADSQWARVGSTNLNIASWVGNCEIDVAIENEDFALQLAEQYERDLEHATEIVLSRRRARPATPPPHHGLRGHGSAGRSAVGAMRVATTLGAALGNRRVLSDTESRPLVVGAMVLLAVAAVAALWPQALAWPLGALAAWIGISLVARWLRMRSRRKRSSPASAVPDAASKARADHDR